jgi:nitrite reductase/ring-hydroxylating ferredoxin subunit
MSVVPHKANARGAGAEWPPSWGTMPHGISVGRYIDPAFQQLEYERLWSRVWQVAARVDEIPEAGDYTTYEIGDQSVLLVRVDPSTVKAYYNVCPHRGTALAEGCGAFHDARIICPFHGWRWDITGKNQFVLERQEFRGGQLRDSDVALKEVKSVVEIYSAHAWSNCRALTSLHWIAPRSCAIFYRSPAATASTRTGR